MLITGVIIMQISALKKAYTLPVWVVSGVWLCGVLGGEGESMCVKLINVILVATSYLLLYFPIVYSSGQPTFTIL